MDRLHRLLLITFVESFATVLVERGLYFFTKYRMGFDDSENLWLALGYGIAYMAGALLSHRFAVRFGEKRLTVALIVFHMLFHASIGATVNVVWLFVTLNLLLAFVTGAKWPVVESYISAGRGPADTAAAIGKFNVSWALSVPIAMACAGPLMKVSNAALFLVPAAINIWTLWLLRPLEPRPAHLSHDHPERLPAETLSRYRGLMLSSRWSLVASYTLLFLAVPLFPTIYAKLGTPVIIAPALAGLLEVFRWLTFVVLQRRDGWHGRTDVLVYAAVAVPIAFLMVMFGADIPGLVTPGQYAVVLSGELLFGLASGLCYYAALYYAMVISNASVESGGAHESLIGGGFAFGPAIGLIGVRVSKYTGNDTTGILIAVLPFIVLFLAGGLLPLRRKT